MRPIKILFISNSAGIAGAEICLLTMLKYLDRNTFDPVVLLPTKGPLQVQIEQLGITTYVSALEWFVRVPTDYGLISSDIWRRVKDISCIIEKVNPSIVHTNTSVIWEGALAARFNGVPHIWHLHEKLAEHPSLKPLFPLSFTYCLMDLLSELVVTASESVKQQLEGFIPDSKIRVILNGVEPPPYLAQDGPSLREELSLPVNTTVVVTIGSIIPEKGYDDLLKAARRVREVNGNVAFLIVGGGAPAEIESLKNAINLLGLSQTVFYLGYRTDVRRVLADSDILVLPSLSEAFSLVTVEAMAAGKPVIATDCGGPSEIIIDGETGFIVPVHDPLALSTKILQLAESKDTISEMSKKGQERYEQNFRAEFFAGNFARLFLELGTNAKVVPLTKAERIVIEGFMEIYQRLAEQRLSRQLVQKLKKGSKVFTNMPLNTLARIRSWCLRSNKRNKC